MIFHWGADGPHVGCSFIGVIFHWGADGPHVECSFIGVIFHWGADGPHVGFSFIGNFFLAAFSLGLSSWMLFHWAALSSGWCSLGASLL